MRICIVETERFTNEKLYSGEMVVENNDHGISDRSLCGCGVIIKERLLIASTQLQKAYRNMAERLYV